MNRNHIKWIIKLGKAYDFKVKLHQANLGGYWTELPEDASNPDNEVDYIVISSSDIFLIRAFLSIFKEFKIFCEVVRPIP